jgi:radical SAM enzyme (rSAM/lipoprotein system)
MRNKFARWFFRILKKNEIALHDLNYLFWECTWRCNLACIHCGSDCKASSEVKDMPFEDFLNAILPLKNVYPKNSIVVAITGGEAILRKDLPDCGRKLRENGFRWGIVTNGYNYDKEMHSKLLSAGMGAVTLSLDGLKDNHNWIRNNPNSFDRAVNALKYITSSKRLQYDVVTCVNQRTLKELNELKDFLISQNVKNWRLFTIDPIGRAKDNPELQLSNEDFDEMMQFIIACRKEGKINTYFSCEAYVGKYEAKVRDSYFFCRAGVNVASVLIDGSISACPNINRHFVQGNIYQDDLLDVWQNKFQVFRDRSWCKVGKCKTCTYFKDCNGGAMHLWTEKQDEILKCFLK